MAPSVVECFASIVLMSPRNQDRIVDRDALDSRGYEAVNSGQHDAAIEIHQGHAGIGAKHCSNPGVAKLEDFDKAQSVLRVGQHRLALPSICEG